MIYGIIIGILVSILILVVSIYLKIKDNVIERIVKVVEKTNIKKPQMVEELSDKEQVVKEILNVQEDETKGIL